MKYLAELWRYRDLLFWLTAKEIKVRYKLPLLGFLWALLVPFAVSLILWVIFSRVLPVQSFRSPFFLFLIAGMFPWSFFAQSVSQATMSVLDAGSLVKKTVFPRAVIPLAVVAANGFNFLLTLLVVVGVILIAGHWLSPWLWLLPVVTGLHLAFTTGVVLLVAGLQVRYRDIKYLTEVGLVLWFYLTPIFYPLEPVLALPVFRTVYLLNPFVALVELYRLALLGETSLVLLSPAVVLGLAVVAPIGVLLVGLWVFRRHEPTFADWVMG